MISEIIIAALFLVNYGYVEAGPNPLTIIGGNETNETYKYLVSIQNVVSGPDDCAGSIISHTFVITAAHCVHGLNARDIIVMIGCTNPEVGPAELLIDILEPIVEHPHYNDTTLENDISLLRLNYTLVYGPRIGALRLPIREGMTDELNMTIKAIGFGESISEEGDVEYTNTLKIAYLKIKNNTPCEALYRITLRSQICAEYEDVYVNYRDAGSPVIFKERLIGIVSWTEENNEQRGYIVLVRVPNYLLFILGIIGQNP